MKGTKKTLTSIWAPALGIVALLALHASPANGQGNDQPTVRSLPINQSVERLLNAGETHVYSVELKRGDSLQLDLIEKGVNCVVAVITPDGDLSKGFTVNFGNGFDRETLTYITQDSGKHMMGVGARSSTGLYSLTARVNSTAGPVDQIRASASRSLAQAIHLWASSHASKDIELVIKDLEISLSLWKDLKEDYWVGYTANSLGRIYTDLSDRQKAIEYLNLALKLFQQIDDKHGQALATNNLGIAYSQFQEFETALNLFTTSLALREKTGDEVGRARVLSAIGAVYSSTGPWRDAISNYEKALSILENLKSPDDEANTLSGMGTLYLKTGDTTRALSMLTRALSLLGQTADTSLKSRVLNELGAVNSEIGNFHQALEYYRQSMNLAESSGQKQALARACSNIGKVYYNLGELQEASAYIQKSLTLYREIGDEEGTVHALSNLARLQNTLGDERSMAATLAEAEDISRKRGSLEPRLRASLLLQMGDILAENGRNEAAALGFLGAIEISRDIEDKSTEIVALNNLANIYWDMGDKKKSLATYYQAFIGASSQRDPDTTAAVLSNLMRFWRDIGNPRLAVFYGKEAINKYQLLRKSIRPFDREIQKSYLRTRADTYEYLADLLLEQGRYAEALQVINSSRDQQFYDFDREQNTRAEPITLTSREAAFSSDHERTTGRVATLGQQLDEYSRKVGPQPSGEEAKRLEQLVEQFTNASRESLQVLNEAIDDFSRPPAQSEVTSVNSLTEMQSILRALSAATGQKTVALYTLAGEDNFRILLVTPDSAVSAKSPVGTIALKRKILQYYALLQSPAYDPRLLGQELYEIIVKPIDPALRAADTQTLLWSLSGTLRYVPMASLWDGERYLVERYQHVVFTRADRERMTRAVAPVWTGVGFGNSQAQLVDLFGNGNKVPFAALPGVTQELQTIFDTGRNGGIIKGTVVADRNFTKKSFLDISAKRYPLVHVASHFSFRPGNDTQSFLVLGDGTMLTLDEMKQQRQLFEGVELLTLSACDTAALRADALGKEIDGFAESAQRLGAKAVLATLWTVADTSTPRLMIEFYRWRQKEGPLTKAEALRRAQIALLKHAPAGDSLLKVRTDATPTVKVEIVNSLETGKGPTSRAQGRGAEVVYVEERYARPFRAVNNNRFAHPYYWAPFILIGNGR